MAWNDTTNHIEPDNSCPKIDSIIECVTKSIEQANAALKVFELDDDVKDVLNDIVHELCDIESDMEDIRTIASTLRVQREHYKDQVDKIEEVLS